MNIFSLVKTVCGHKGKELRKSRRDGKRDRRDTGGKEYVEYKRVYQQDGKGNTPAHLAARYGMLSLVEFFLSECDFYPFFRNFLGHVGFSFNLLSFLFLFYSLSKKNQK